MFRNRIVVALLCTVAQGALAEPFAVDGMNKTVTHACTEGEEVVVSGQKNVVTFTGACKSVSVTGQGHAVSVEQVEAIVVSGLRNAVVWAKTPSGKKPKTSISGLNNSVKHEPTK